jgi:hypothetical protein
VADPAFTRDFDGLQGEVISWLHRTDLNDRVASFISLAEDYLQNEIGFPSQETVGTVSITAGASSGSLPTYFSRLRNAYISSVSPIVPLTVLSAPIMRERYPLQDAGIPRACTIIGSSLYVDRPTDTSYTVTVDYWQGIVPLSSSNTTNWLLTKYANAYLFSTLLMAAPFLGVDTRIQTWEALASRAINSINIQGMLQGQGAPLVAQLSANVA